MLMSACPKEELNTYVMKCKLYYRVRVDLAEGKNPLEYNT